MTFLLRISGLVAAATWAQPPPISEIAAAANPSKEITRGDFALVAAPPRIAVLLAALLGAYLMAVPIFPTAAATMTELSDTHHRRGVGNSSRSRMRIRGAEICGREVFRAGEGRWRRCLRRAGAHEDKQRQTCNAESRVAIHEDFPFPEDQCLNRNFDLVFFPIFFSYSIRMTHKAAAPCCRV